MMNMKSMIYIFLRLLPKALITCEKSSVNGKSKVNLDVSKHKANKDNCKSELPLSYFQIMVRICFFIACVIIYVLVTTKNLNITYNDPGRWADGLTVLRDDQLKTEGLCRWLDNKPHMRTPLPTDHRFNNGIAPGDYNITGGRVSLIRNSRGNIKLTQLTINDPFNLIANGYDASAIDTSGIRVGSALYELHMKGINHITRENINNPDVYNYIRGCQDFLNHPRSSSIHIDRSLIDALAKSGWARPRF